MNWNRVIFAGIVCGMVLIVGIVITAVCHWLKRKRDVRIMRFMKGELMLMGKRAMVDAMLECMDMIPSKMMEAKNYFKAFESE